MTELLPRRLARRWVLASLLVTSGLAAGLRAATAPPAAPPTADVLPDFTAVARKVGAAVVNVQCVSLTRHGVVSGSGVIVGSDGVIVTARDLATSSRRATIILADHRMMDGVVLSRADLDCRGTVRCLLRVACFVLRVLHRQGR